MQIPLLIYSKNGPSGVASYLSASDTYLESSDHRRSMNFTFPNIGQCCPLCQRSGCARWKGYYSRYFQDSHLMRAGLIVIRYGSCRHYKSEFSLLPDFLLPRRRTSILTLSALENALSASNGTIQDAVDIVIPEGLEESNYLPSSTAYSAIKNIRCIVKSKYIFMNIKRKLLRRLLEPESFRSVMILSILNIWKLLQQGLFDSEMNTN